MRQTTRLRTRIDPAESTDPREQAGGEVIDLATRRVLPAVTQRRRSDGAGMAAGIALVAGLGLFTFWMLDATRIEPLPQAAQAPPEAPSPSPPVPAIAPAPAAPNAPAPAPVLAAEPQGAPMPMPLANPLASPTVVFDASALPEPASPAATPPSADPATSGTGNDAFAARLGVTGGTSATARASFDPATTVTQGTLIPAVLETAIDTDVPGYVRAIVSSDVRSFDGARVLVPRSSRLIGQYKSGVQAGQKRAYVIWTRLIRPDGVSVDLASPAVMFGGETGLAGKVNSHFFERFGSAMLLSVVGGLSAIGSNASVVIGSGGQSAAAAAVGQSAQVSPTIRVKQGEPIRVFTARDLDFSKVARQ